jgi:hypothetical protein
MKRITMVRKTTTKDTKKACVLAGAHAHNFDATINGLRDSSIAHNAQTRSVRHLRLALAQDTRRY